MHNGNFFGHSISKLQSVDWWAYRDYIQKDVENFKMSENVCCLLRTIAKDMSLFVVSSSGSNLITTYLSRNGVRDLFCEILGGDFLPSKAEKLRYLLEKYLFDARDVVFVTDTLGDILEANEAGIKTIAVDFGFHSRGTLEKGNPFAIISDLEDLLSMV